MRKLGEQLLKNILSSWFAYGARITIAFLFLPYITSVMGESRYGLWVIIFQLVNYFSLADFGLDRALTRQISKHLAVADYPAINRVLATAGSLCGFISLAITLISLFMAMYVLELFPLDDPLLLSEGKWTLVIIGLYWAVRFLALPFGGSIQSFQRADIANALSVAEEIARALLLVYFLSLGLGLPWLGGAIFSVSLLRQIGGMIWLRATFPKLNISWRSSDAQARRELFSYSKISFGITLCFLILYGSDSILLGLLISSSAAGVYAPAAQLLLYVRHIVNAAAGPIIPAISHLEAIGDQATIRKIYLLGLKYTALLSTLAGLGILVYAQPFVDLWLTGEFGEAGGIMMILAAGLVFYLPQIIGNAILWGTGNHRYLLWAAALEAGLKITLSFYLIEDYGIYGVALATSLPQLILYGSLYPVIMARLLDLKIQKALGVMMRSIMAMLAGTGPVILLTAWLIPPQSWPALMINVLLVTLAGLAVSYGLARRSDIEVYQNLNQPVG